MIGLLWFVLAVLASPFQSKMRLEAENAVLRHQTDCLRRNFNTAQPSCLHHPGCRESDAAPPHSVSHAIGSFGADRVLGMD